MGELIGVKLEIRRELKLRELGCEKIFEGRGLC